MRCLKEAKRELHSSMNSMSYLRFTLSANHHITRDASSSSRDCVLCGFEVVNWRMDDVSVPRPTLRSRSEKISKEESGLCTRRLTRSTHNTECLVLTSEREGKSGHEL